MSDLDILIGKNLTTLRGSVSQQELAALMRDRNHKWSQATVWSVEKGERPLRLHEAVDLASVLGQLAGATVRVDDLFREPQAVRHHEQVRRQIVRTNQAEDDLQVAAVRYLWELGRLDQVRSSARQVADEELGGYLAALNDLEPDDDDRTGHGGTSAVLKATTPDRLAWAWKKLELEEGKVSPDDQHSETT